MMHDKITVPGMKAPHVKGHMKIQLHDAETGELTQEIERDNYVAEQWFEQMSILLQYTFGTLRTTGSADPNFAFASHLYDASDDYSEGTYPSMTPFAGLMLTDYAGAVDPSEERSKGVCVGGSQRNLTNSGAFGGSYNASESEHRSNYHRFVYDFATSQGNGSIQSIYTGPFWTRSEDSFMRLSSIGAIGSTYGSMPSYLSAYVFEPVTGSAVGWSTSTNQTRFYISESLTDVIGSEGYSSIDGDMFFATNGVGAKGAKFFILEGMRSDTSATDRNMSIYSIDASVLLDAQESGAELTLADFTLEKQWVGTDFVSELNAPDVGDSAGGSAFVGLVWCESRNSWFMANNYPTDPALPDWRFVELSSTDWSVLGEYPEPPDGLGDLGVPVPYFDLDPTDPTQGLCEGRHLSFDHTNRTYSIDSDGPLFASNTYYSGPNEARVRYLGSTGLIWGASRMNLEETFVATPRQQFFSRVRLDAPVVKDETNTMKVVYEFTIDRPDIFS